MNGPGAATGSIKTIYVAGAGGCRTSGADADAAGDGKRGAIIVSWAIAIAVIDLVIYFCGRRNELVVSAEAGSSEVFQGTVPQYMYLL